MKHILVSVALIAGLASASYAADGTSARSGDAQKATEARTDTMFVNEDGSLQGKPVVDGPADWSHMAPDRASTGASGGESGADAKEPREAD